MGIKIPQINSCCCCSLKTGTIIIGVLHLIMYLLYFIDISGITISYAMRLNKKTFTDFIGILFLEQSVSTSIVFSLLLIYGAFKEKSNFVMAWLIFGIATTINSLWILFWNAIRLQYWEYFLSFTGFSVLYCLLIFVVFNYYRKIPKNKYIFYYQYST